MYIIYISHILSIYKNMGMLMIMPTSSQGLLSRGRNSCGRGHFQRSHRSRGIRLHGGRGHSLAWRTARLMSFEWFSLV